MPKTLCITTKHTNVATPPAHVTFKLLGNIPITIDNVSFNYNNVTETLISVPAGVVINVNHIWNINTFEQHEEKTVLYSDDCPHGLIGDAVDIS